MTKERRTLKAINDAITHWEQILKVLASIPADDYFSPDKFYTTTDLRMNRTQCPLCQITDRRNWYKKGYTSACDGCPIYEIAGSKYCCDTPFMEVMSAATYGEATKQAQREWTFLNSIKNLYRASEPSNKF